MDIRVWKDCSLKLPITSNKRVIPYNFVRDISYMINLNV